MRQGDIQRLCFQRFQPSRVLRSVSSSATHTGRWLRRGLVVLQFALSAAIIVGTIVVYQQLGFMQMKNLGFDGEQVVVVRLSGAGITAGSAVVNEQLLRHSAVVNVSLANVMPAHAGVVLGLPPEDVSPEVNTNRELFSWVPINTDSAFVETLGLRFVAGRSFGPPAGNRAEVLINELAARELGWSPEEAIGKPFWLEHGGDGMVVGVVRKFPPRIPQG